MFVTSIIVLFYFICLHRHVYFEFFRNYLLYLILRTILFTKISYA